MQRRRDTSRRMRGLAWTAGATLTLGLLAASPARAGGEFERAFQRELGRIAAHEAVHAGRHVAGAIAAAGVPVHRHRTAAVRAHRVHVGPRHGHAPGHYRGRGHARWKHLRAHHGWRGHDRHCRVGRRGHRH